MKKLIAFLSLLLLLVGIAAAFDTIDTDITNDYFLDTDEGKVWVLIMGGIVQIPLDDEYLERFSIRNAHKDFRLNINIRDQRGRGYIRFEEDVKISWRLRLDGRDGNALYFDIREKRGNGRWHTIEDVPASFSDGTFYIWDKQFEVKRIR